MARFVVGIGQTAVATDPGDTIEMIGLGSCAGIFVIASYPLVGAAFVKFGVRIIMVPCMIILGLATMGVGIAGEDGLGVPAVDRLGAQ